MDPREAMDVLELTDGAGLHDIRLAYRRLVRTHHPDVAGGDERAHARTARLTQAYEVIVSFLEAQEGTTVCLDATAEPAVNTGAGRRGAAATTYAETRERPPGAVPTPDDTDAIGAEALDQETIAVAAPPAETYVALHEAAGRIGEISYVDRHLGILEMIVRFEGGPSCSVLMTLQGRAHFTEVFCTMESIEAAPTPPIAPVITALVAELQQL
jgi:hypothetical protein